MFSMKIYVACPAGAVTGGPEALHQLVHALTEIGFDAYLVYSPNQGEVTPAYQHYKVRTAHTIIDSPENCFIVPEIWPRYLEVAPNTKKYIWWLSVDNRDPEWELWDNSEITHLAQSTYAYNFLKDKNVDKVHYLREFIGSSHTLSASNGLEKQNLITYNPKKGKEFTERIKNHLSDLQFVPIIDMTTEQVRDILRKSKLYIDFGHHPGQDRLVREAALAGCTILVGNRGSAKFYEDVPIPARYKFSGDTPNQLNIQKIRTAIQRCLFNFEEAFADFNELRKLCLTQKDTMYKQIAEIFGGSFKRPVIAPREFTLFRPEYVTKKIRPSIF